MTPAGALPGLRRWARRLRRDATVLWLAGRDPRTPWTARLLCALAAGYALSPIDLIPDVIPVLGVLDEAVLLPALIWLAARMIPRDLMVELRSEAERLTDQPVSRTAAAVVIALWTLAAGLLWLLALRWASDAP